MLATERLRWWSFVHRWSSLVCTLFLLILCVTGLPLIFKDEIEEASSRRADGPSAAAGLPSANLDELVAAARGPQGLYPGEIVRWISLEDDKPEVWIALAPSHGADRKLNHVIRFDVHTGRVLEKRRSAATAKPTPMGVVFWVHKNLLAGAWGEWLLAAMGLMLLASLVSGAALYGGFMRKLSFGTVRRSRGRRIRWLDLHNFLGIATLVWLTVVGATGVLNEISEPMYGLWREQALPAMLQPYKDKPVPTRLASVQAAADRVAQALPGMKIRSVRYPDVELGSPHHYLIWAIGNSPLTSRLFQPALVDAVTGELSSIADVPWYLLAAQLARPLHFGDYGGMPMKLIWAALDLVTIIVLCSGLYLWLAKRRRWQRRE